MLGSLLLFCVSVNATYTISSENRLTKQSTTTEPYMYFAANKQARGESKYTRDKETGEISCNTAVSNCDILQLLKDDNTYIDSVQDQQGRQLTSVEERVLEVLGHLQEV